MWPTAIGEEACNAAPGSTGRENAEAEIVCPGLVDDDADKCVSDAQCEYTAPVMSVWMLVTLITFVVIPPLVWKFTNPNTRPPAWFKLSLLFLSFMVRL